MQRRLNEEAGVLIRTLRIAAAALLFVTASPGAVAAAYPTKAVTFIVPFPAGGRTDLIGRIYAQHLPKYLGNTVVVVNKPGASGNIGASEVRQAQPDGYTLGFFSSSIVSSQYTVATPVLLREFEAISIVNEDPAAIAVGAGAPWKSLRELVDSAKKNQSKLKIGMIPGASAQIFAGGFTKAAGVQMVMVPFKGDADGAVALAGGHIDVHVAVPVSYKALAEARRIRILGVAADSRQALYKDLPTFKEHGVDLVIGAFHGVYTPRGTPADVMNTISAALGRVANSPELIEQMNSVGAGLVYLPRAEAPAYLARQDQVYKRVIEDLGMMAPGQK
jgi:tripartite-type tricarboxylate transporter receptor subunit TctC